MLMPMSISWMMWDTSEFLPGLTYQLLLLLLLDDLPYGTRNLCLSLHEIDLRKDLFLPKSAKFVVFIVSHFASLALAIVERRTAVLCEVVFCFVNH